MMSSPSDPAEEFPEDDRRPPSTNVRDWLGQTNLSCALLTVMLVTVLTQQSIGWGVPGPYTPFQLGILACGLLVPPTAFWGLAGILNRRRWDYATLRWACLPGAMLAVCWLATLLFGTG